MSQFLGLELPATSISAATERSSEACANLKSAIETGDLGAIQDAADLIRNEASRMQALASTISRYILDHKSRRVCSI